MAGSSAEREIRDALVAFLREVAPDARIIHELNVGGCRADVVAVDRQRVMMFEIKSEKDTIDRLHHQMRDFARASHVARAVLHRRWFKQTSPSVGRVHYQFDREKPEIQFYGSDVWIYPRPEGQGYQSFQWTLPRPSLHQPHARRLLELLWREELITESKIHGLAPRSKDVMDKLIQNLSWNLTGQQIAEAVCRQLRGRPFAEADDPIIDKVEVKAIARTLL